MLTVRPDLAQGFGDRVASLVGSESHDDPGFDRVRAELAALRQGLDAAKGEVATLRAQLAGREEREQAMAARLAAVEARRLSEPSLPLATASIGPGPLESPGAAGATTAPGHPVESQAVEPPQPSELPTRRPAPAREADRAGFGPAQVKSAAASAPDGPRGIQIATGPSVDALRISWMLLAERHKEILKKLEPRFLPTTNGSGPAYRLIAGPLESTSAANRVCGELRARRVTCGVSAFGGEPL